MQCFDEPGATILRADRIYAKNNDDCSMNQDESSTWSSAEGRPAVKQPRSSPGAAATVTARTTAGLRRSTSRSTTRPAPTKVTFKQTSDVSLCPREERSHGYCTTGTDPNTAICTWTEGNTQPQRDGTWMAAIDICGQRRTVRARSSGSSRSTAARTLTGRRRTYSMRAMHDRIIAARRHAATSRAPT